MRLILFVALNIWLFFTFALNTLVELKVLGGAFAVAFVFAFVASRAVKSLYHRYVLFALVAPLLINLFFVINFIFSSSPQSHSYYYTYPYSGSSTFISIHIEGGQYDNYKGIRYFTDFRPFMGKSCVTYTIEEGLFGIEVVKDVLPTYRLPE